MKKIIITFLLLLIIVICLKYFGLQNYLTFEYLKQNQQIFSLYYQENKILTISLYFLLYIIITGTSIPGATIMSLLGGFLFGNLLGITLVSFASSLGATLAFLISRYLFSDFFRVKFSRFYKQVNQELEKDGIIYLLSLRFIPIIPFWLVNLIMGLTQMKVTLFYIISQIGMFPATLIFVNAGTQFSTIKSPEDIFSPRIILSFTLLGITPLMGKWLIILLRKRRS